VAIDDYAGTTVAETQPVKPALIAELTWAKLYTKAMHKYLLTPAYHSDRFACRQKDRTRGGRRRMRRSARRA